MDDCELITLYPRLFQMADLRAWQTIERLGLRSTTSLLDLLGVDGDLRHRLEAQRRPHVTMLEHAEYGRVVIRDQKPLNVDKLARCLTDMTVEDWLKLLNRKVFFWPHEHRVQELLGAKAYRDRPQLVLTVDTASLVAAHGPAITLAAINTGRRSRTPSLGAATRFCRSRSTRSRTGEESAGAPARRWRRWPWTTPCQTSPAI